MNKTKPMIVVYWITSLVLLGGLAVETVRRPRASEAEGYHARVRALAEQAPLNFGEWIGTEQPVPTAAIKLLKPNVILSRTYVNPQADRAVAFLLVHCKDARDINGHYPPNCEPAHGMTQASATETNWKTGDIYIPGIEYHFVSPRLGGRDKLVDNFIIIPGQYVRDMQAVAMQVGDHTKRFYGAAQVQLVFHDPARWTEPQRREAFETFMTAYRPLIEEIRNGAQP